MKTRLFIILALAFALRFAFFIRTAQDSRIVANNPDSPTYLTPAASLANDGRFFADGHPETGRTPGYPLFLALLGVRNANSYRFAQFVQILLDVWLVYLTFLISKRLWGPGPAMWAALLQALSVLAIFSSVSVMSDSLFALLTAMIVWVYVCRANSGLAPVVAAALLTVVASFVRPVGFVLVPAQILVLSLSPGRFARVATFLLIFAAGVAPWFVRNDVLVGYAGFSSIGEADLLYYEAAAVRAARSGILPQQARVELKAQYDTDAAQEGIQPYTAKSFALERALAMRVLRAAPGTFIFLRLRNSLAVLLPASTGILEALGVTSGNMGTLGVIQTQGVLAGFRHYFHGHVAAALLIVPELLLMICCYGGFAVWAFSMFRNRSAWQPPVILIAILIPTFMFVVGGAASVPRFRVPVESLLNSCAGAGIAIILRRRDPASRVAGTHETGPPDQQAGGAHDSEPG